MVTIRVDNKTIEAREGGNLLQACLESGVYIPHLCYLDEMEHPSASCRMCFVEIEGKDRPVSACTENIREDMIVRTDTPAVRSLQRSGLQLLLSTHEVDCARCPANKNCGLQNIAKFLGVGLKPKHLEKKLKDSPLDDSHPCMDYYPNRCILCGKCIFMCRKEHGVAHMSFAKRGIDTVISFYGVGNEALIPCASCKACVGICPVGALVFCKVKKEPLKL